MNALFPLDLIAECEVTPMTRVMRDEFEAGNTSTRRLWPAQYFKRRFKVVTPPLTEREFITLRSFWSQRSGEYDAFWFRDNVNRGGQAQVRFTSAPRWSYAGARRVVTCELEEISPVRALIESDEIVTAANSTPLFWWDANRERSTASISATGMPEVGFESSTWDASNGASGGLRAVWQGSPTEILGLKTAQSQGYLANGTAYAKTAGNTTLSGTQPACTVFALARNPSSAAQAVLVAVGTPGSGSALGLQITAANKYAPWVGASEAWATAVQTNSAVDTWRTFAVVWAASSNTATLYVNAASVGAESNTRSLTNGRASLLGANDGTKIVAASGYVGHALVFPAALALADVKAVHNLLAPAYGLATV